MERKTIKIISVGQWKDVGKARVLTFAGEDRVNYETWSETFAEHIKVGNTIEADVEFSEKVSGDQTYFHNKVVQIYINGQPIKSKGRFTPDSPEKIASIESQKRADLICQLWIAGRIPDSHPLVSKAIKWLSQLSDSTTKTSSLTPIVSTPSSETTISSKTSDFANAGEFLTACQKNLGLNRSQVLDMLDTKTFTNVNFTDAYQFLKDLKTNETR